MKRSFSFFAIFLLALTAAGIIFSFLRNDEVKAEAKGETIVREKTLDLHFDAKSQENAIDLKKVIGNELSRPEECDQTLLICQIEDVKINLHIVKTWRKLEIPTLSNFEFANAVPPIQNDVDHLTKEETVILQEVLARRGLLKSPEDKQVSDRGFLGPVTQLALSKLAHIKKLNPKDSKYKVKLKEKINELLSKMAKNEDYVEKNPLPKVEDMTPKKGDPVAQEFEKYKFLTELSKTAPRVEMGSIPVTGNNVDVKIEGFLNVEKIGK